MAWLPDSRLTLPDVHLFASIIKRPDSSFTIRLTSLPNPPPKVPTERKTVSKTLSLKVQLITTLLASWFRIATDIFATQRNECFLIGIEV